MKKKITLRPELIQQLLFTKTLLSQTEILPEANPSSFSIARKILNAHDAAELGIAAIADQLGALPDQSRKYLMDYFAPIKDKKHKNREVKGKEYFRKLNEVRGSLKHGMILPDPNQWLNVQKNVYNHLSGWCQEYLKISLDDLDSSILLRNPEIKGLYEEAKKQFASEDFQKVLESIAQAAYVLFKDNSALRSLQVGIVKAEDAIKLAAFGVHANDYLALQEFLPQISRNTKNDFLVSWQQKRFGHPGNWRKDSTKFCMSSFLDLALKIQDAGWIPGPIDFLSIYEHKIEAIKEGVEIDSDYGNWVKGMYSPVNKVIKVLKKGESIRGVVSKAPGSTTTSITSLGSISTTTQESDKVLITMYDLQEGPIIGYVPLNDVKITCVPVNSDFVKEYFPKLPIMGMQLD